MYIDPSGNSTYALDWKNNMGWLPVADGPIPAGDLIYGIGYGGCLVVDNWGTITQIGPAAWDWTQNKAVPWIKNTANDAGNWFNSTFGGGSSAGDPNNWNKIDINNVKNE